MRRIKNFVENHASAIMLAGGVLGLLYPYGDALPGEAIILFLAALIFCSCFKLTAPMTSVVTGSNALFCLMRFILFPLLLWLVCRWLMPDYTTGLFLLALCPVAAAGPALASLYRGNVTQVFALTIVSNLSCVVIIPAALALTGHNGVHMPVLPMLRTLALCIVLPCGIYGLARHNRTIATAIGHYGRIASVLLVGMIVFLVLTKKRDYFLAQPAAAIAPLVLDILFYLVTLYLGLFWTSLLPRPFRHLRQHGARADRIGYMVSSSLNNVAIGAGLAFLYFDEKTIAIFVTGELAWCLMPFLAERAARHIPADAPPAG